MKVQDLLKQFNDKNIVTQKLGEHDLVRGLGLSSMLSFSNFSYAELVFKNCSIIFIDNDFETEEDTVETHLYYSEDSFNYTPIDNIDKIISKNPTVLWENATLLVRTNEEIVNYHIKEALTSTKERQQEVDKEIGILSPHHDEIGFKTDDDAKRYDENLEGEEGASKLEDFLSAIKQSFSKDKDKDKKDDKEEQLKQKAEFGYANGKKSTSEVNDFMKRAIDENEKSSSQKYSEDSDYIKTETGYIVKQGLDENTELSCENTVISIGEYKDGKLVKIETSDIIEDATIKELEQECEKINSMVSLAKVIKEEVGFEDDFLKEKGVADSYHLENIKDKSTGDIIWIKA